MRRPIYECRACGRYCTTRTDKVDDVPARCLFWHDFASWVRIDKHEQKQLNEFRPSADPAEEQELAGSVGDCIDEN